MSAPRDAFHERLDACQQCEQNPFGLCREGEKLLQQAVNDLDSMRVSPTKKEGQTKRPGPLPRC